jgi:hypothetical protein
MKRLLALALALVGPALSAQAADLSVTIVEHGLYTADVKSEKPSPDGIGETVIENICHYATTTAVPLKIGVRFGFRFRIDGLAAGETVDLVKRVAFPIAVKPPRGSRPLSEFLRPMRAEGGKVHYTGYTLDYGWELMPGRWDFQIYRSDRRLGGMAFTLVDGTDAPKPSAGNSTCFKLSSR